MEIKELRVGVYVNLEDKGVYMIDSGQDIATIDNCWTGTDYCTGILLTDEWLWRFGFNIPMNGSFYTRQWFELRSYKGIFIYDLFRSKWVELKYVHQLQNLYFALTGEELTIKQNKN